MSVFFSSEVAYMVTKSASFLDSLLLSARWEMAGRNKWSKYGQILGIQ